MPSDDGHRAVAVRKKGRLGDLFYCWRLRIRRSEPRSWWLDRLHRNLHLGRSERAVGLELANEILEGVAAVEQLRRRHAHLLAGGALLLGRRAHLHCCGGVALGGARDESEV